MYLIVYMLFEGYLRLVDLIIGIIIRTRAFVVSCQRNETR